MMANEGSTVFFGFAIADSMFRGEAIVRRMPLTEDDVRHIVARGVMSCCNPSHVPTIAAMRERFGFDVTVPEKAPLVSLYTGDALVVMSVRGLPRLEGRHEYTAEEITNATFSFALYVVEDPHFGRVRTFSELFGAPVRRG
jgi:hypothetical protein